VVKFQSRVGLVDEPTLTTGITGTDMLDIKPEKEKNETDRIMLAVTMAAMGT
jgi:hypothetical protein